jgi:hypothetical protein
MKNDPLDFWKKYELISSSNNYPSSLTKEKVCRFCGKSDKGTTFNQDTHLLPELLGKNRILTFDECDKCNAVFGDYESSLSIFIRPHITLLGIKGKKKIPTFQSRTVNRNEKTRTVLKHAEANRKELILTDSNDYKINKEDKTFDIIFRKPPFVPLKIYKALLKIGLSILPTHFDKHNSKSFEWLTNRRANLAFLNYAFMTSLTRSYFSKPYADLYRAKKLFAGKLEFPEYSLVLCFANQVIQIFLPFSDELEEVHSAKRTLDVNLFPAFAYEKFEIPRTIEIKTYNLGISTSVSEDYRVSFSYDSAEFNS